MKILFFLICIYFFISVNVFAQINNSDSLFKAAQHNASVNNYDGAIKTIRALIKEFPQNIDYKIFLGRVYSWMGNYNLSIETLTPVVDAAPTNADALEAIINTYRFAKNYRQVINYSNRGLSMIDSQSFFFTIMKAHALENMGQDKASLDLIAIILIKDSDNKEALALRTSIHQKKKSALSISYQNTSFSNPGFAPWHLGYLEYKQKINNIPWVIRAIYGRMFSQSAVQFEIDLYPKLNITSYLYFNAGISKGDYIFPSISGGLEYYKSFKKIDASIGGRYLHFKTSEVIIATGHIAYNIHDWQIAYRPFFSLLNKNWYPSHVLSLKKSNYIKEIFLQLDIQYGIAPYDFLTINEFDRISSTRVGIQYQFRINMCSFIRPVLMYEYEEYFPKQYRNRFNAQIIFTKRF